MGRQTRPRKDMGMLIIAAGYKCWELSAPVRI